MGSLSENPETWSIPQSDLSTLRGAVQMRPVNYRLLPGECSGLGELSGGVSVRRAFTRHSSRCSRPLRSAVAGNCGALAGRTALLGPGTWSVEQICRASVRHGVGPCRPGACGSTHPVHPIREDDAV